MAPTLGHAAPVSPQRVAVPAKTASAAKTHTNANSLVSLVRCHIEVLAGAWGRGSVTDDELAAARGIAAELKCYGIVPAGQNRTFFHCAARDSLVASDHVGEVRAQ